MTTPRKCATPDCDAPAEAGERYCLRCEIKNWYGAWDDVNQPDIPDDAQEINARLEKVAKGEL